MLGIYQQIRAIFLSNKYFSMKDFKNYVLSTLKSKENKGILLEEIWIFFFNLLNLSLNSDVSAGYEDSNPKIKVNNRYIWKYIFIKLAYNFFFLFYLLDKTALVTSQIERGKKLSKVWDFGDDSSAP